MRESCHLTLVTCFLQVETYNEHKFHNDECTEDKKIITTVETKQSAQSSQRNLLVD